MGCWQEIDLHPVGPGPEEGALASLIILVLGIGRGATAVVTLKMPRHRLLAFKR